MLFSQVLATTTALAFFGLTSAAVRDSCLQAGKFAMTFDGGPSQNTGKLLQILRERNAKVSFHINVKNLNQPAYLANIRLAAIESHLIGISLLDTTIDLTKMGAEAVRKTLSDARDTLKNMVGVTPVFVRFPMGKFTDETVAVAESLGMYVTSFNFDSQDYMPVNQALGNENILNRFKNQLDLIAAPALGDFISGQSDLYEASVNQSGAIVDYIKTKGYTLVTLDECIGVAKATVSGTIGVDGKPVISAADSSKQFSFGMAQAFAVVIALFFAFF